MLAKRKPEPKTHRVELRMNEHQYQRLLRVMEMTKSSKTDALINSIDHEYVKLLRSCTDNDGLYGQENY